jgi:diguanylate cyclase (GGDEF)-like protein
VAFRRTTGEHGAVIRLLLAALAYAATAQASQELLVVDGVAPVWAASGVAVAIVWRWGLRGLVVLYAADVAVSVTPPVSLEAHIALGTATATCVEAALAAWVLRRVGVRPELDRLRDVWGLAAAAVAGAACGAIVGATVLELADKGSGDVLLTWRAWAFGDALGTVLTLGLVFTWLVGPPSPQQPARTPEVLVGAAALAGASALSVGVSSQLLPLAFPLLVLGAYRGRARGTLAGVGAAAAVIVLVTASDEGPFVAEDLVDGLVSLQALVATVALTLLALAAALSERERVTQALRATTRARDRAESALRQLALRDPLTGLANRDLLADRITQGLARAQRSGGSCGVVFIDLDRFKALNDAFGHARGDELLRRIAPRIARAVRPSDTVARFGGDEFVVVCDTLDGEETLRTVAARVLAAVAEPVVLPDGEIAITATAGLALSGPGCVSPEELLRDADAAMYAAKRGGSGSIRLHDPTSRDEVVERLELENALRGAAGRGELWLAYQPIVAARDDRIIAVEALLRWRHPQRGEIGPDQFIGLAETTGLIGPVGEWVLRTACEEAVAWGSDGPRVAVNVSPRQLLDPSFIEVVASALRESGLDPARLELELTETAALDAAADAGVLDRLVALGVRLALDDVGTGWSSLGRVRDLPLATLKIDRVLVADVDRPRAARPGGRAIVSAVVAIGVALGLEVVAEGIEREGEAITLREAGATALQGYLIARPMPAADLRKRLGRAS